MLDIRKNPFGEPILKFIEDLKKTKWKFPFILQIVHALITFTLLLVLSLLYISVGFISQVSNSFWELIVGLGQKMSFSSPFPSLFYAISATVYFILFLPFFIVQLPFWISGWITSKIGFRVFVVLLITFLLSAGLLYFQPKMAKASLAKIIEFHDSVKAEYFASDSLNTGREEVNLITVEEKK